uniref:SMI1/KNR4 family protein n=1 Tax=Oscillatoriales cyanobacterium SpSt-402 TaxID=2282168 RepID=A0A832H3C8_9CYAN
MAIFDWDNLLSHLNQTLIEAMREDMQQPSASEIPASGWLGYPGASEELIVQAETRLGTQLPPSYREFLQVSNGWRRSDWTELELWSVEQIDWFRSRNLDWINCWQPYTPERPSIPDAQYFVYGEEQDPVHLRREYLETALEISSNSGDGDIYLLIPEVVDSNGEWEAWHFGNKLPGAYRYRSFYELMQQALVWGRFVY